MTIENANSHPYKVALTSESDGMFANSHPYKVSIVEGGTELVSELPEEGKKGAIYVLVDDAENPTKVYGMYIYDNGWVLAAQPVDQAVQLVEELPEEGEEGVLYYVPKTGQTDTYDLYRWINDSWVKVDTDIVLYSQEGNGIDGAMTQSATTAMKGKAKVLTTANYNWNSVSKDTTAPYDSVALWLLEDGLYSALAGVKVGIYKTFYSENPLCYLVSSASSQTKNIYTFEMHHSYIQKSYGPVIDRFEVTVATGVLSASASFASRDTVTSMITDYIKSGNGTPSGVPIEGAGVLYEDKTSGELYQYDGTNWNKFTTKNYTDGLVGVARVLTADDYNYPIDNPKGVALWLLPAGTYTLGSGCVAYSYEMSMQGGSPAVADQDATYIVGVNGTYGLPIVKIKKMVQSVGTGLTRNFVLSAVTVTNSTGYSPSGFETIGPIPHNSLSSDSTDIPLAAYQGKVLNDKISNIQSLIRNLSSADYDYPDNNPAGVALWRLSDGIYHSPELVKVYPTSAQSLAFTTSSFFIKVSGGPNDAVQLYTMTGAGGHIRYFWVDPTTGDCTDINQVFLKGNDCVDNLLATTINRPLSANQGKVLKETIDSIAIKNAGAPTTATVGTVGQILEDTTNGKLYICTAVSGSTYTWDEVATKGYVDNIVGNIESALNIINNGGES